MTQQNTIDGKTVFFSNTISKNFKNSSLLEFANICRFTLDFCIKFSIWQAKLVKYLFLLNT